MYASMLFNVIPLWNFDKFKKGPSYSYKIGPSTCRTSFASRSLDVVTYETAITKYTRHIKAAPVPGTSNSDP